MRHITRMSIPLKYSALTANHIIECDVTKEILFNTFIKTQVDDEDYIENEENESEDCFDECEDLEQGDEDFNLYENQEYTDYEYNDYEDYEDFRFSSNLEKF